MELNLGMDFGLPSLSCCCSSEASLNSTTTSELGIDDSTGEYELTIALIKQLMSLHFQPVRLFCDDYSNRRRISTTAEFGIECSEIQKLGKNEDGKKTNLNSLEEMHTWIVGRMNNGEERELAKYQYYEYKQRCLPQRSLHTFLMFRAEYRPTFLLWLVIL